MATCLCIQTDCFYQQKGFGREAREAAWAAEQRTIHGLQSVEAKNFSERSTFRDISFMAEEAKRRAGIARFVLQLKFITLQLFQHISSQDFS